jgi:uncharacterized delta-60 repeat protein
MAHCNVGVNLLRLGTAAMLFFCLSTSIAQAQVPTLVYKTQIYGRGNTDSQPAAGDANLGKNALAVDAMGNSYVAGKTFNGLNADFLTVKYNAAGVIQWRATTNGSANGDDLAYAIALDPAGNVYVTGSSESYGQTDFLTVKFDANGVEQWRAVLDGAAGRDDAAYAIAVGPTGNVFITGVSLAARSLAGYNYNWDYLTVSYSADGVEQWRVPMDLAGGIDKSAALCLDNNGGLLVTGYGATAPGASYDYVTVKYGEDGAELWRRAMNRSAGADSDAAYALACDAAGNAYVTGQSTSDYSNYVRLTVKYDSDGNVKWRAILDNTGNATDAGFAVAVEAGGGVIVAGQGNRVPGSPISITSPAHVTVKYDALGNKLWDAVLNGSGSGTDTHSALAVDGMGNIYTTGYADNNGRNDLAVVKYAPAGSELWRAFISGSCSAGATLMAIRVDGDGNVIAAGYRSNGIDNDFLVVKFNGGGQQQWCVDEGENNRLASTFSSGSAAPNLVSRNGLAIDALGNAYVTGRSGVATGGDFVTAKVDGNGAELWRAILAGAAGGIDQAYAIAVDGGGNVYSTGDSISGGRSDFMTVKYDAGGTEQWRVQPGQIAGGFNSSRAIAVDGSGDVIVTGFTSDGADFLTIKYSASGVEQWKRTANGIGNGTDTPVAMAVDPVGNIYVTGRSFDGNYDGYLTIKYSYNDNSSGGPPAWRATLSGSATAPQQPFAIAVDVYGNVVVAGDSIVKYDSGSGMRLWQTSDTYRAYALALGPDGAVVTGGAGGLIVKRDNFYGGEQWRRAINGAVDGNDVVYSVAVDADGSIYATGRNVLDSDAGYVTVKYNSDGAERWRVVTATGGAGMDASPAVALDTARSIIVAGNARTAGSPSAMVVTRLSQAPAQPTGLMASPGNGVAMLRFTPPAFNEGPITGYLVACQPGNIALNVMASPVLVPLANDILHSCTVTASSAFGASMPSVPVSVMPSANAPLAIFFVRSSKVHGAAGSFALDIDFAQSLAGAVTVEPRTMGTGHQISIEFNAPVTTASTVSATNAASQTVGAATATFVDNRAEISLTGIPESSRLMITLTDVNGTGSNFLVPIGFLLGDVTKSGTVSAGDISAMKVRTGQVTNSGNYLFDVNLSGTINSADVSVVKARAGQVLQ